MSVITEYQIVDNWYDLGLGKKFMTDHNRFFKCLELIFANHGLKLLENSKSYRTVEVRYKRIVEQIGKNKKKPSLYGKYHGFSADKTFYSTHDFPDLCAKENEDTTR